MSPRVFRRTATVVSLASLMFLAQAATAVAKTSKPPRNSVISTLKPNQCTSKPVSRRLNARRESRNREARFPALRLGTRPYCGTDLGACKYAITDAEVEGNWVATALYFCYNGGAITYMTPTGGNTQYGIGSGFGLVDWDQWTYCCLGNYHWSMHKIADFVTYLDFGLFRHDCVKNEIHLYGNGTVIYNSGWWNRWTWWSNQTDCALGPG